MATQNVMKLQEQAAQVIAIMVPLPAQGHLNQLLHLSRLISSYNIPVHYVGSITHNRQVKLRAHGWDPAEISNIHFHDFPTPPFVSPPPNPNASNKFPSHLLPLFYASSQLRDPFFNLIRELSTQARRIIVVSDGLMASVVQDVPSIPNAECYCFRPLSAFTMFSFFWEFTGKSFPAEVEVLKPLPTTESCVTPEHYEFSKSQREQLTFVSGNLFNSSKLIEGPYLDLLEKEAVLGSTRQWAIGPLNPVAISKENPRHECFHWLDKQPQDSVIFVSFGTTTSLTDEQITELATGLEKSGQKFLWVVRDADTGDVFTGEVRKVILPEGYEDRIRGRGIVVKDWAPQLQILGHPATGGFMSHCGWNSCMESISMGVPIAAWPMHSDQPRNALLITKLLKIGLNVMDWEHREKLVTSSAIEVAVRTLMGSVEGDEMRKRVAELGEAVRQSVEDGGVARVEFDSFIAHITR